MNDELLLDILVGGRVLIAYPHWWVQGANRVRRPSAPDGYARCAGTACERTARDTQGAEVNPDVTLALTGFAMAELRKAIPVPYRDAHQGCGIIAYNDDPTTTHADIIAMFDIAIGRVRARIAAGQMAELSSRVLADW